MKFVTMADLQEVRLCSDVGDVPTKQLQAAQQSMLPVTTGCLQ
jgi:hypothetical protein